MRDQASDVRSCLKPDVLIEGQTAVLEQPSVVHVSPRPVNGLDVALKGVLAFIFSIMGIAIFLRARNRPVALISYRLFSCMSFLFCLQSVLGTNALWVNLFSSS